MLLICRNNKQSFSRFITLSISVIISHFRLLSVNESVVFKVPTIQKLRALYDNYELDASTRENVTPDERIEEKEFLDAVLDTKVMKTAMEFLHHKGSNMIVTFHVINIK